VRYSNRPVLLSLVVGLIGFLGLLSRTASAQTGTWEPTGSMTTSRIFFSATLLLDGKVLVAGGRKTRFGDPLARAELYDPNTGTWTGTGSMTSARDSHSATLLLDGKVLVAGGADSNSDIASAELYDPSTGTWTPTGSMSDPRSGHMATLITVSPLSGSVLVAGGTQGNAALASAELYDPSTGSWSDTTSMTTARFWETPSPVTLSNGSVLVVGGLTSCCPNQAINKAETYDPVTETWVPTSGKNTGAKGRATRLLNGQVLVAGGRSAGGQTVAGAELFDASTDTWSRTARMSVERNTHTLTLLASGRVLVAGGYSNAGGTCNTLTSAELYGSGDRWRAAGNMTRSRFWHQAVLLPNGLVLVVGGQNCGDAVFSSAELYRP
jgi:hypothetical protein